MKLKIRIMTSILVSLGLLATGQAGAEIPHVENPYGGTHILRGTVVSMGRVDPTENIGTGFYVDANYTSVALNGGIATKRFGESPLRSNDGANENDPAFGEQVTNVYAGVGFSRVLQLQGGYGSEGQLVRLRSDFNFRAIADFFSQTSTPKQRLTLADRITFTISVERYRGDKEIFNNSTWGVGLLF